MFGFGKKQSGAAVPGGTPDGWQVTDLGALGTGGMALVHRVRDEHLGRVVAFKALRPELAEAPDAVSRFVEEARITAQLEHPNVPPVYAAASDAKRSACFTMKLLEGQTLQQILAQNEKDGVDGLAAALDVVLRVCDALAYAHSRGVLHLDVKPANVMVGAYGQVYLVDWGLAQRREDLARAPKTRTAPNGTPAYMPPEQALGEAWRLDERSDVFAVGAMLYRVLTGRPPFVGATYEATLAAAQRGAVEPPKAPSRGVSGLPRRLVAICLKALQPDPAQRHPTVNALKAELEAFVRGVTQLPQERFAPGQPIVREGEAGECAYVVLAGQCQATRSAGGRQEVLRTLGPGEMFGETAIFARTTRSATVTAVTEVVVALVDRATLEEQLERNPYMALAIRTVAARFLELDAKRAEAAADRRLDDAALAVHRALVRQGQAGQLPWTVVERIAAEAGVAVPALEARLARAELVRAGAQLVLTP